MGLDLCWKAALRDLQIIQLEPRVSRSEAASSKRLLRMVPGSARNWSSCRVTNNRNQSSMKTSSRHFLDGHLKSHSLGERKKTASLKKLLLFSVAVLLAGGAAVCGQSTLDGFDPDANGPVSVVVVQPDGKILIGGYFTTLSPNGGVAVTRNHIARLNPDGTLDLAFDPNANDAVWSIAVQADGKILAAGNFTSIGGHTRNCIARLDATTGLADSFDPNANNFVQSIAVQADGKILAAGAFTFIGAQTRNYIARLDATTGLADSFNPNAHSIVVSIAVQADGKILAAGNFFQIGGQPRNYIARLDATTGLADSFDPNADQPVNSIAVQMDDKVLIGGGFSMLSPNGGPPVTRNRIARLNPDGTLDTAFDPNANGYSLDSIAVQADGKVLAGGDFTTIGGQPRNYIARLDATTGLADSFDPNANLFVQSIAVQPDGKILAVGDFTFIGGQTRNRIARFLPGLQPTGAVSRKTQGVAFAFDINLPLSGEPGVECRSSGGNYTEVVTFTNNVTSGSAAVTAGTGSISGSPTFSGNTMTVNLTGVIDAQKITVTLTGVTDVFSQVLPSTPVSMDVLIGDVTGNRVVNATDVGLVKSQVGQAVTASNFREDVNADGSISSSDVALTKSRVGNGLPP
jgi:uncharacterized delta-60 repeat protein